MLKTIERFVDLQDGCRIYKQGDTYPAEGAPEPSNERIKALSSTKNRRGIVLIADEEAGKKAAKEAAAAKKKADEEAKAKEEAEKKAAEQPVNP